MERSLLFTTATLFLLGTASAMAQSNNVDTQDPNCTSAATAGCPNAPDDINTQSGPGTTGGDSQPENSATDGDADGNTGTNDGDNTGTDGSAGTNDGDNTGNGNTGGTTN